MSAAFLQKGRLTFDTVIHSAHPAPEMRESGTIFVFVMTPNSYFTQKNNKPTFESPLWVHTEGTSTVPAGSRTKITIQRNNEDLTPSMLSTIKRLTGWTWDQLATALGKSRQAVHGWTHGREITAGNLERLAKLHSTMIYLDRGSVELNQAMLSMKTEDGFILADLLEQGKFSLARELGGPGAGTSRREPPAVEVVIGEREQHWFQRLAGSSDNEPALEFATPKKPNRKIALRRRS